MPLDYNFALAKVFPASCSGSLVISSSKASLCCTEEPKGAYKRCSQEVLARSLQGVLTRGAHKRCLQRVLTRGAHKVLRGAHKGAYKSTYKRCLQERKLAIFWRKVARTLNKHKANLAEA